MEYRFCRVLFGVASSSFLLSNTLISRISQFYQLHSKFVVSLLNSLYADDLNGSSHTIRAFDFFVKCKERLPLGGFNLRKFQSNNKELEDLVVYKFHERTSDENSVLGLMWNKCSDKIVFDTLKICKNLPTIITKRSIIQLLAGICGPLGLINPLIVKLKVLI